MEGVFCSGSSRLALSNLCDENLSRAWQFSLGTNPARYRIGQNILERFMKSMKASLHLPFVFSLGLAWCGFSVLAQQQERVVWAVRAGGPHPDVPWQLTVDSENNTYILGATGGLV